MEIAAEDYFEHYGTPRHSGRYPWGTSGWGAGEITGSQRNMSYLDFVAEMRKEGMSDSEIAAGLGMTSTEFRRRRSAELAARKQQQINQARDLRDKGYKLDSIAEKMGVSGESYVRSLLAADTQDRLDIYNATRDMLRDEIDSKGWVDVGSGVENKLGISSEKKQAAITALEAEGYKKHYGKVKQLGTGEETSLLVMGPKGSTYKDYLENADNVQLISAYSEDGGRSYVPILPPKNIDSKRVAVRYAEEGGADADGTIYVRPGVPELSLGKDNYAQVRIAVDGTHYLKGMAVYKDDLPRGVDLMFNTNKSDTGNKLDAMKGLKDDPLNPFGSIVRQREIKTDSKGNQYTDSVMNIVNDADDWEKWSKNLSSQVLSKQRPSVAKEQLNEAYLAKKDELDEIRSLTNPTVRRKLLETYAEGADAAAVHMKAAAMPRQRTQVLLPINSLKDNEIYAPNFRSGESVVLIRYPHGGTFEIPELKVNNRNTEGRQTIGSDAPNAVGINSKVAARLSGADFDGDTVLVIPNGNKRISSSPALKGLDGFEPQKSYPPYDGMRTIDGGYYNARTKTVDRPLDKNGVPKPANDQKQKHMGVVSNLITDMTIRGAPPEDLAKAVRHSMVVIDAEKHMLDYKASEQKNNIKLLQQRYQGDPENPEKSGGAATIISRAKSEKRVADRRDAWVSEGGAVDPVTGERRYVETGKRKTIKSTRMAEAKDAYELIDGKGTTIERVYADHSNRMKGLANRARLEAMNTPPLKKVASAERAYAKEASELKAALNEARTNAPRERQAQILANKSLKAKRQANPHMTKEEEKKAAGLLLNMYRARVGAEKKRIEITPKQWEAIQAGAISNSVLRDILNNTDDDRIKTLATPRRKLLMTSAKTARAQAMLRNGYTQAEVADALGVSLTTLKNTLNE